MILRRSDNRWKGSQESSKTITKQDELQKREPFRNDEIADTCETQETHWGNSDLRRSGKRRRAARKTSKPIIKQDEMQKWLQTRSR